jgi:hypothetical protein
LGRNGSDEEHPARELRRSSRRQAAVRLLACIEAAAQPTSEFGPEVVGVIESQMKLQALDFWLRYPDYLANELLNEFEVSGQDELLAKAIEIVDSREPDLRRFPMVRYLFGAFEPLDDALSLLSSYDFIRMRRIGTPGVHVQKHLYLLTAKGRDAMQKLAALGPELAWYTERAALAVKIAGSAGGTALKDRQYLEAEYSNTKLRDVIAPITSRVRARIDLLKEK